MKRSPNFRCRAIRRSSSRPFEELVRFAPPISWPIPRYGKREPYKGMPPGHLPVRSYLAVPVTSRTGDVLGGLFFGHPQPGMFNERAERILMGLGRPGGCRHRQRAPLSDQRPGSRGAQSGRRKAAGAQQDTRATCGARATELAASTARLEESERRFRLLVEGVTDYAILHARPDRHRRELESGRAAHQGLHTRGNHRPSTSRASTPRRTGKTRVP